MSELKVGAEYQENIGMADTPSSTFVAKEAETRVSCEHAFEEGDGGKTEHPSNLDPEGTDPPFKWNFDVCTNLLALMACFFASTWALVTPSSAIAFIAQAFPTEAGIAIWIGTSLTAFVPQEIVYLFTSDAILTGVYSLPFNLFSLIGSIVGGVWMMKTKEARTCVIFSGVVLLVGNCMMIYMQPHINFAAWFFPNVLLALSIGIQTALIPTVVSLCTPNHLIAGAISISSATRGLGGSIGITIFSQIFQSKVKAIVPTHIAESAIEAGLPITSVPELVEGLLGHSVALLEKTPGITPAIIGAAEAGMSQGFADAFRYIWYALIPFAVVALVLSWWLKSTKAQMTAQIAAGVEHRH